MKLLICGTGVVAEYNVNMLMPNCVLLDFIDNYINKIRFHDKFVYSPDHALNNVEFDYIILASSFSDKIYK